MRNYIRINQDADFDACNVILQRPFKHVGLYVCQVYHLTRIMCLQLCGVKVLNRAVEDSIVTVHLGIDRDTAGVVCEVEDAVVVQLAANMKVWMGTTGSRQLVEDNLVRSVCLARGGGRPVLRVSFRDKPDYQLCPDTTVNGVLYLKSVRINKYRIGLEWGVAQGWRLDTGRMLTEAMDDEEDDDESIQLIRPSDDEVAAASRTLREALQCCGVGLRNRQGLLRDELQHCDQLLAECECCDGDDRSPDRLKQMAEVVARVRQLTPHSGPLPSVEEGGSCGGPSAPHSQQQKTNGDGGHEQHDGNHDAGA
jgi:hypothetical protein